MNHPEVHGTENGYSNYRCRCRKCKAAHAEAARTQGGEATMDYSEVTDIINQPDYERARQSLYKLMREGLTNGASIPEIETEAEQAAHHMLGCVNYIAMICMYAAAVDLRKDEPLSAAAVSEATDDRLMLLTEAILAARGPIGEHTCQGRRQPV